MKIKAEMSLAARILKMMYREHEAGIYIFTLAEAAAKDEGIAAGMSLAGKPEIMAIERYIGEAQVEMLFETSDAAVVGLRMSSDTKHAIFLEHLERNIKPESRPKRRPDKFIHSPKA